MIAGFVFLCLVGILEPGYSMPSELASEARPHNERGIAAIESGAHAQGVEALERAYALMPDPLVYRAGRSKVLGSIRSALNHLHTTTGDPAHLRRLHALLLRHLEALLAALGDAATPGDADPYLSALREVEEILAREPEAAPLQPIAGPPVVTPPTQGETLPARGVPAPAGPARDARRASPTALRAAIGVLYGVAGGGLGAMVYGLVVHTDSRRRLQVLTASVLGSGAFPSEQEARTAEDLRARGQVHRTLAISTGIIGGMALVTAAVLHGVVRRRAVTMARAGVSPALAPGLVGLEWRLRF